MESYKISEGQRLTIEGIPVFATKDTTVEIHSDNIGLLTPASQSHVSLVSALDDAQSPSLFATDGQRTTDAECWMNYCLEAEKELTAAREASTQWEAEAWRSDELLEQRDNELTAANETIGKMIDTIGMLETKDKATTEQRDELANLVKQFIYILDITEESDGGRLFHPTNITSCRAGDLQKAGELVEALRRASRDQPTKP